MKDRIKKASTHTNQNEGLIFEKSSPGKRAFELPPLDVPAADPAKALGAKHRREGVEGFPEVSEIEVLRHFTRLSTWNYAIDLGMYPLGSCTMKYNPRVNEAVARLEGIAEAHPYQPEALSQGCLGIMKTLSDALIEITGMDAITLQPAAGAHGEFTGILLVRAYHESKGNPRKKIEIHKIADILHAKGALLYMDGANMNALVGKTRPGDFGVDVMHLNLHKTFSTPHGGGGPGSGPVACKRILEPFLPTPVVVTRADGSLGLEYNRPQSVGRVRMFYGNFGMFVRALAYILANGPDGLRQTTEDAVLNANYIRAKLEGTFELQYKTRSLHEVVFSDRLQARNGVKTGDMGKRLIDYGFHAYTVSFPMVVQGAMMIEPTESESREELDLLIDALKQIAREAEENPELVQTAPHSTRIQRLDETTAARKPILRWKGLAPEFPTASTALTPDTAAKEW